MSHDSLSEDLFEVLWHNEVQKIEKIALVIFPKISIWGNMGLIWNTIMKIYSRYTMVIVNFARVCLLGENDNLDPIWAKIMQPYFVILTMM